MKNIIINEIHNICDCILKYNFANQLSYYKEEYNILTLSMQADAATFDKSISCRSHELFTNILELTDICNKLEYINELNEFSLEDLTISELEFVKSDIEDVFDTITKYVHRTLFKTEGCSEIILTITAGSGGSEAEDWAGMLQRMYLMWASNNKMSTDIINTMYSFDAPNGIKKSDIIISGKNVYDLLKHEVGVHRLIRKSPFSKTQSRHTSFAGVKVIPNIDNNIDIVIDEKNDVRIDTLRGHGAGGQHRNKTDSACRLTHLSTGIVVFCQSERSQHSNKANAFKILRSRLYDLEYNKQLLYNKQTYNNTTINSWGNQIRSYTLHPVQRIKDHRNNYICNDFNFILDGNIDGLILSLLMLNFKNING